MVFASSLPAQTSQLTTANPISSKISGGTTQSYEINLVEGDFAHVVVDQINVDIAIKLFRRCGKRDFCL